MPGSIWPAVLGIACGAVEAELGAAGGAAYTMSGDGSALELTAGSGPRTDRAACVSRTRAGGRPRRAAAGQRPADARLHRRDEPRKHRALAGRDPGRRQRSGGRGGTPLGGRRGRGRHDRPADRAAQPPRLPGRARPRAVAGQAHRRQPGRVGRRHRPARGLQPRPRQGGGRPPAASRAASASAAGCAATTASAASAATSSRWCCRA